VREVCIEHIRRGDNGAALYPVIGKKVQLNNNSVIPNGFFITQSVDNLFQELADQTITPYLNERDPVC
jgi:hypothetical protein